MRTADSGQDADRTGQDRTGQYMAGQDGTQDRTGQDRTMLLGLKTYDMRLVETQGMCCVES